MSATTGSFSIGNSTVQMPVKTGTLGPSVVDIGKLYAQSGMFTYDPGSRVNLAFLKFVFRKDRKQARRFAPEVLGICDRSQARGETDEWLDATKGDLRHSSAP
jgi:hypothetical protein